MYKFFLLLITIILFISCDSKKSHSKINFSSTDIIKYQKKTTLSDEDKETWIFKDIIIDSIPGV